MFSKITPRRAFFGFLAIALLVALGYRFWPAPSRIAGGGDLSCVSQIEERTVAGNSLTGVVEDGQRIEILFDYYDCNEARRGDVVAFAYAGNDDPLVKLIKALPGDTLELVPDGGGWRMLVNGGPVLSPSGESYTVNAARYPRLHLYEEDYGAGLPADTYLLLGTDPADSFDSRAFGLVHKSGILGKAEPLRR